MIPGWRKSSAAWRQTPASPQYNSVVSTLEERMEDFAPVVIVIRAGVEVRIPMDEFMADAGKIEPGQAPA